jgi:hypothetical protein
MKLKRKLTSKEVSILFGMSTEEKRKTETTWMFPFLSLRRRLWTKRKYLRAKGMKYSQF